MVFFVINDLRLGQCLATVSFPYCTGHLWAALRLGHCVTWTMHAYMQIISPKRCSYQSTTPSKISVVRKHSLLENDQETQLRLSIFTSCVMWVAEPKSIRFPSRWSNSQSSDFSVSSSTPCTCRPLVCLCCRHFHGPWKWWQTKGQPKRWHLQGMLDETDLLKHMRLSSSP